MTALPLRSLPVTSVALPRLSSSTLAQIASGVASVLATGVLAYALTWITPGWPHGLS